MSKIIRGMVVGDLHNDNRQPKMRKDDYCLACLEELNEIVDIGEQNKVDYILFLGDIFHRMDPSGSCRNGVIKALQRSTRRKLIVVGNHDISNSFSNLMQSALGTLIIDGHLEFQEYFPEFGLGMLHYKEGIHQQIYDGAATKYPALIWAAHAYIVPSQFFDAEHVIFDDMPLNPECKLVTVGHLHTPMELQREDKVNLINPGSIGRPKASAEHLGRQPSVLLLKYTIDGNGEDLQHKYVELSCSQPPENVFYLEEAKEQRVNKKRAKEFVRQVAQLSAWTQGEDKYLSLRNSGKQKEVPDEIIDIAEAALRAANEGHAMIND